MWQEVNILSTNGKLPESCFLPTVGGGYPWASPASRWSAACPGSPDTSLQPPCTPYTLESGASSRWPCLCPVRGPQLRSARPLTERLDGPHLTAGEAGGGGWRRGDAWWERRGREAFWQSCQPWKTVVRRHSRCDGTQGAGHSCACEEQNKQDLMNSCWTFSWWTQWRIVVFLKICKQIQNSFFPKSKKTSFVLVKSLLTAKMVTQHMLKELVALQSQGKVGREEEETGNCVWIKRMGDICKR